MQLCDKPPLDHSLRRCESQRVWHPAAAPRMCDLVENPLSRQESALLAGHQDESELPSASESAPASCFTMCAAATATKCANATRSTFGTSPTPTHAAERRHRQAVVPGIAQGSQRDDAQLSRTRRIR
jgi:hypothetical protein